MGVTTIDPKPALVVIDLQKGIVGLATVHPVEGILERAATLAKAFRGHGLPVVLVNVDGGAPGRTEAGWPAGSTHPPDWTELADELEPQPGDHRITKRTWGAFHNTSLDAHLRGLGVTQVVLCGIATSAGVESTARAAHEHGYHVVLATDAMTDRDPELHRNSVERVFPRLGERAATAEIVRMLGEGR
jgi:nicotinamidase-related amidase